MGEKNAWEDLQGEMGEGETLEKISFGEWGWGSDGPGAVPPDMMGRPLDPADAQPLMRGWSFFGGYGAPECYAVTVWTSRRVIWVTQYDGSTRLDSAPRNPEDGMPCMPGGG